MSNHSMSLEKPDGWIVKNTFGAVELFLHHERAVDAFNAWGSFIGPVYQHAPQPVDVAQTPFNLGDIVSMRDGAPFTSEWRGIKMKVVSLRIDPQGTYWVSVVDETDGYPPHHRGNGFYDGETTDIDAGHLCSVSSTEGK